MVLPHDFPHETPQGLPGRDERSDHHLTLRHRKSGQFRGPTDILPTGLVGKSQITAQTGPQGIPIQQQYRPALTPQYCRQARGERGLARSAQAKKPEYMTRSHGLN